MISPASGTVGLHVAAAGLHFSADDAESTPELPALPSPRLRRTLWSGLGEQSDCGGPVLVADGDDSCRALVARLLSRVGYRILEAANGYEALELAGHERPRIVLLDVELSGVSDYETCHELASGMATACR